MGAYRDDKLLQHKKAIEDLEEKSWLERLDLLVSIDSVLLENEDRERINEAGFNPDSKEGLTEAKDRLVELGMVAKAKNYFNQAKQNFGVLAVAGILSLGALASVVDTSPHNIGEAAHLPAYNTIDLDAIECSVHNNDCTSMQSVPQDEYNIVEFIDISGSMRYEIQSVQEAALEVSSAFAGQNYYFTILPRGDFPMFCYTGPPETRNVGECHGGLYASTDNGTILCVGQVLPSLSEYDLRNGLDDDCDGCVDNLYGIDGACITTVQPRDFLNFDCEFDEECEDDARCLDGICGYL